MRGGYEANVLAKTKSDGQCAKAGGRRRLLSVGSGRRLLENCRNIISDAQCNQHKALCQSNAQMKKYCAKTCGCGGGGPPPAPPAGPPPVPAPPGTSELDMEEWGQCDGLVL